MQRQHYDMTVTRLNNELEKLRGEKIALEAQLDNNNNHAGHFKPSFTKGKYYNIYLSLVFINCLNEVSWSQALTRLARV